MTDAELRWQDEQRLAEARAEVRLESKAAARRTSEPERLGRQAGRQIKAEVGPLSERVWMLEQRVRVMEFVPFTVNPDDAASLAKFEACLRQDGYSSREVAIALSFVDAHAVAARHTPAPAPDSSARAPVLH